MTPVTINGETLIFDESDAKDDNKGHGFKLPILHLGYLSNRKMRYAIDSNKRVWLENTEEGYFESPCLMWCLCTIKSDPEELRTVKDLIFDNDAEQNHR